VVEPRLSESSQRSVGLLDLLRGADALDRDHVVINEQAVMTRSRLAVDEAVRLDGRFLGIRGAPHHDALVLRPLGRLARGRAPQHVGEQVLEAVVRFQLALDLHQEGLGDRLGVRKNRDREIGVAQDLLDHAGKGDDGRFVVIAAPQVQMAVGIALDLAAAREQPGVARVAAAEQAGEQKIAVVAGEKGLRALSKLAHVRVVPSMRAGAVEIVQLVGELRPQPRVVPGQIALAAEFHEVLGGPHTA
jgi:hypothetical protein